MKTYAPHQQRVIDEKSELDIKITALDKFIQGGPVFETLPNDEQGRLEDQLTMMEEYSAILGERIEAFGPPDFTPPPLDKTAAVARCKTFRQKLDTTLQEMKAFTDELRTARPLCDNTPETFAQHIISTRDLESAIMRQGMVLKNIGNPDPYPQSRNPEPPVVEPTADGLKL